MTSVSSAEPTVYVLYWPAPEPVLEAASLYWLGLPELKIYMVAAALVKAPASALIFIGAVQEFAKRFSLFQSDAPDALELWRLLQELSSVETSVPSIQ